MTDAVESGGELQTVLVIDDQLSNLQLVADILTSQGYDTLVARDGESGIDKAGYAQPDLILLDVLMPGLDGFETCRRLKASARTRNIPVVFLTSAAEIERKLTGFEVGGVDYLTKPLQVDEVLARVKTHLALRGMQKQLAEQNAQLLREMAVRQEAERGLRQAQAELEHRVADRTAELSLRNRELSLLNRVVAASVNAEDEGTILDVACHELTAALDVPYAAAALVDDKHGQAIVAAQAVRDEAWPRGSRSAHVAPGPTAEHVLACGQLVLIDDAASDSRAFAPAERTRGARSLLAVPLVIQGTTVGVLELCAAEPQRFAEEKVKVVQSVASQVSGVLARLRLRKAQQRLEAQYFHAQKMEALGRLTGGVAHDFNNLLTVILGSSDLLLRRITPGEPFFRDLSNIRTAGERAAKLTSQLLAFSRQQVMQPRILDLNAVLSELEDMLRRLLGEDIELLTVLAPGLGTVRADATQLEQVVVNLAVNARDAMPVGGKLTIETADVTLDDAYLQAHGLTAAGAYVLMAVSDTGVGMDPETQSRVFEPFFTTKAREGGTGLGLATTHGIVTQTGGHIAVYSEPGHGTTFKVYFPRVDGAAESLRAAEAPTNPGACTETVEVLEDDGLLRDMVCEVLRQRGYEVLAAKDADQARRASAEHAGPIHLLLTDVVIAPGSSGVQVARELTASRPETRVLYMSGYTVNAIVHRGALDPGIAFLRKPFTPSELTDKVREVLDAPKP